MVVLGYGRFLMSEVPLYSVLQHYDLGGCQHHLHIESLVAKPPNIRLLIRWNPPVSLRYFLTHLAATSEFRTWISVEDDKARVQIAVCTKKNVQIGSFLKRPGLLSGWSTPKRRSNVSPLTHPSRGNSGRFKSPGPESGLGLGNRSVKLLNCSLPARQQIGKVCSVTESRIITLFIKTPIAPQGPILQGYLAHKKTPTPLGPPYDLRHRPTVGS